MFFYFQVKGGEEAWAEGLADSRQSIIAKRNPRYSTILDLSLLIDDETSKEDMLAIRYRGPMYFDFDSDDLDDVITRVQKFIKKLEDLEVDLDACQFYATGKKGFHCTIPAEMFVAKPSPKGTVGLPHIYKELAYALYVDTMDLRVYSARKGRMFRTVNVERENGKFKVQVTPEEIKNMTEEVYAELVSAPRNLLVSTTPKLNDQLAVMYSSAEQKVVAAAKRRGTGQKDVEALAKFKGEFPPSILKIMQGEGTMDDAGFNKIAMQLGITANGLGKTEDEYIVMCAGLIQNHVSDGFRYNTPAKREAELRRMFDYTQDNVCYTYSVGAIKSIMKPGESTPDLDGLTDQHGTILDASDGDTDESIYGGVYMTDRGIFRKSEDGITMICDLGFQNIDLLIDMSENSVSGFETDVFFRGVKKGRRNLGLETFTSKSKFLPFVLSNMGVYTGSDNHVTALVGRMRDIAMKHGGTVLLVHKEGLDLIPRHTENGTVTDIVWVSPDSVVGKEDLEVKYRFSSKLTTHGMFKSDLMDAPDFDASEETALILESLLNLNEPYVVGNLLGWMTSCFHRQIYHKFYNQFPICQIFGQAGSGKSSTVHAMLHLFYYLAPPRIISANGPSKFTIDSHMQSSATIPCALDEYKPRQFSVTKRGELLTLFREAYNANAFGKGGGNGGVNSSWRDVQLYSYSAPLLFIGEAMETETAVLERSVSIPLSKAGLSGRKKQIQDVRDQSQVLASLGKEIVQGTFRTDLEAFKKSFNTIHDKLTSEVFQSQNDRVLFNVAVVLHGLTFLKEVISAHFADRFNDKFAHLMDTVKDMSRHVAIVVMPEAAKALNTLSFMTRTEHDESDIGLKLGEDYHIETSYVDMKMRNVFIKYVSWCHRKSQEPLYDTLEAFIQGLSGFAAVIDRSCPNSVLKDSPLTTVYRFDTAKLEAEGVESFA
jgi:hypothetical protein